MKGFEAMGLNWEKANKREIIWERGSVDKGFGLPKKNSPKRKKAYKFKEMESKFDGTCAECRMPIKAGSKIKYYYGKKLATHNSCNLKGLIK